jgi:quinoprotein glucose dehydrogenase
MMNLLKKQIFIFIIYLISFSANAITLEKTKITLEAPWGMTWLDENHLLITQKSGEIFMVNTQDYSQTPIKHNIPSVQYGQGGMLDIISEENNVWVTCSIEKNGKHTTAIYHAELSGDTLVNEKKIYEALPYIKSPYHFGSRLELKGDYLYASIGERGEGMIAQDPTNSIGTIIRIHKNGDIPDDNPYIDNPNWLPEIYQIGVRNPQGMSLDPLSEDIFISIMDLKEEILLDLFWRELIMDGNKLGGVEQIILVPKWEMEMLGSQDF